MKTEKTSWRTCIQKFITIRLNNIKTWPRDSNRRQQKDEKNSDVIKIFTKRYRRYYPVAAAVAATATDSILVELILCWFTIENEKPSQQQREESNEKKKQTHKRTKQFQFTFDTCTNHQKCSFKLKLRGILNCTNWERTTSERVSEAKVRKKVVEQHWIKLKAYLNQIQGTLKLFASTPKKFSSIYVC